MLYTVMFPITWPRWHAGAFFVRTPQPPTATRRPSELATFLTTNNSLMANTGALARSRWTRQGGCRRPSGRNAAGDQECFTTLDTRGGARCHLANGSGRTGCPCRRVLLADRGSTSLPGRAQMAKTHAIAEPHKPGAENRAASFTASDRRWSWPYSTVSAGRD